MVKPIALLHPSSGIGNALSTEPKITEMERTNDGIVIVNIKITKLLLDTEISSLGRDLYNIFHAGEKPKAVIVNLAGVKFISSSAQQKLVAGQRVAQANDAKFYICGVSHELMPAFTIPKLHLVHDFRKDTTSAHKAVGEGNWACGINY